MEIVGDAGIERPPVVMIQVPLSVATRENVVAQLAGRIAKWWMPDAVIFADAIPHTAAGKILKTALREQFPEYRWPAAVGSTGGGNASFSRREGVLAMKQRKRIYYSTAQRAEIWDRWRRGESMSSIGRRFDRESSSVFSVLSPSGGIRPPERRRSKRALSLAEREEVSRGLVAGRSLRAIAAELGRAPSTISREVARNGGWDRYRAAVFDQAAWERALRPKACKLACHPGLRQTVSAKLRRRWSPEQIAGWLGRSFGDQEQHRVSHETIYKSLYIQARGVLKKELREHLRAKRTIRRSRHASLKRDRARPDQGCSLDQRAAGLAPRTAPCPAIGRAISFRAREAAMW